MADIVDTEADVMDTKGARLDAMTSPQRVSCSLEAANRCEATPQPSGVAGGAAARIDADAATATPSPSAAPLSSLTGTGRSMFEEEEVLEALQSAIESVGRGDVKEALDVLRPERRRSLPISRLAALRHDVIAVLLNSTQDRLHDACDVAVEALEQQQQQRQLNVGSPERSGAIPAFTEVKATPEANQALLPQSTEMLLRALVRERDHSRATEFLRALFNAGATLPGDAVLNSVIDIAVRVRAFSEAWDVLELLLSRRRRADKYFVSILTKSLEAATTDRRAMRRGIGLVDRFIDQQREDVDEIVFNTLLNVLGQNGDMIKLKQTLAKMQEYGVQPSAVTYGTVVKAYGKARDIDEVVKVWEEMRNRRLGVNPVTCGCVLDACVKCGHLDKANAIFQEMRLQGLHKNTVLYATLIKGLAKTHDLMSAVHLYKEMRMEGVPCNLVTFNSLMDVCVRCEDLQAAALFLQDMMRMGIEPDLITFSTLIKGYAHTGEVHKALALAKELRSRGLRCDEIMYNSLIDGCAKSRMLQEGLKVFEEMQQNHVAPSNITFSILVRLYFEAGEMDAAFSLVDDMFARHRCMPNRVVYMVLLRCCASHGGVALERGAKLLVELGGRRNSKMPDQGMVGAIITGCSHHHEFNTAECLIRDLTAGACGATAGPAAGSRGRVAGAYGSGAGSLPQDALRSLFEALGARDDARGQELLKLLRERNLPASSMVDLHAALADGRRNPGAPANVLYGQGVARESFAHAAGDSAYPIPNAFDQMQNWPYMGTSSVVVAAAVAAAAAQAYAPFGVLPTPGMPFCPSVGWPTHPSAYASSFPSAYPPCVYPPPFSSLGGYHSSSPSLPNVGTAMQAAVAAAAAAAAASAAVPSTAALLSPTSTAAALVAGVCAAAEPSAAHLLAGLAAPTSAVDPGLPAVDAASASRTANVAAKAKGPPHPVGDHASERNKENRSWNKPRQPRQPAPKFLP